jgi:predicted transcriptional regulator
MYVYTPYTRRKQMAMQRVQMLLEPKQRRKLAELAKIQGKSIAEVTRQAIEVGLEHLGAMEQRQRMFAALESARKLRDSMPMLNLDVVADLHQIREERDHELGSGD